MRRIYETQSAHANLQKPARVMAKRARRPGASTDPTASRFAIAHFAGVVEYDSTHFVFKNSDAVHVELPAMLAASASPLVATLFGADDSNQAAPTDASGAAVASGTPAAPAAPSDVTNAPPPPPPPGRRRSAGRARGGKDSKASGRGKGVAGSFGRSLEALMALLKQTSPHYVRCIKPTESQRAGLFEGSFVLSQLRCGGTPQLLTLMGEGFPTRVDVDTLCERYRPLLPSLAHSVTPREFVQALLHAIGLTELKAGDSAKQDSVTPTASGMSEQGSDGRKACFALGVRLVFFNAGGMAALDALMHGTQEEMDGLVARVHSYVHRRRWRQVASLVKACNRLERRVQARRALGALALRARALVLVRKAAMPWARRAASVVRRAHAAITLQAAARGHAARFTLTAAREAAITLQARCRGKAAMREAWAMRAEAARLAAEAEAMASARGVAARCVQRYARGKLARSMRAVLFAATLAKLGAATRLQAAARRRSASLRVAGVREQAVAARRAAAAAEKERMRAMSAAALILQACVRMRLAVRRAAAKREMAARAAAEAEKERAARAEKLRMQREAKEMTKKLGAAAVLVQAAARRWLAVRLVGSKRAEAEAVREAKKEAAALAKKERAARFAKAKAATKLQCAARCMMARIVVNEIRADRADKAGREAKRREAAAKRAAERLFQRSAAVRLQTAWRVMAACRELETLRAKKAAEEEAARASRIRSRAPRLAPGHNALNGGGGGVDAGAALSGEAARYVGAVRIQSRWRRCRLQRLEQRDLEEKLMLAEQREEALRQAKEHERAAKEHEEAKVQMFLEMESTLTTLTHEHALQLQAVQKEKEDKERQLQAIFEAASPMVPHSASLAHGAPTPGGATPPFAATPLDVPPPPPPPLSGSRCSTGSNLIAFSPSDGAPSVDAPTTTTPPHPAPSQPAGAHKANAFDGCEEDDDLPPLLAEPKSLRLSTVGLNTNSTTKSAAHKPSATVSSTPIAMGGGRLSAVGAATDSVLGIPNPPPSLGKKGTHRSPISPSHAAAVDIADADAPPSVQPPPPPEEPPTGSQPPPTRSRPRSSVSAAAGFGQSGGILGALGGDDDAAGTAPRVPLSPTPDRSNKPAAPPPGGATPGKGAAASTPGSLARRMMKSVGGTPKSLVRRLSSLSSVISTAEVPPPPPSTEAEHTFGTLIDLGTISEDSSGQKTTAAGTTTAAAKLKSAASRKSMLPKPSSRSSLLPRARASMLGGSGGASLLESSEGGSTGTGASSRRSSVLGGGRLSMSAGSKLPVPAGGSKLPVPSRRTSSIHALGGSRQSLMPALSENAVATDGLGSPPADPPPPPPPTGLAVPKVNVPSSSKLRTSSFAAPAAAVEGSLTPSSRSRSSLKQAWASGDLLRPEEGDSWGQA